MMIRLTINNKEIEVSDGSTVLEAAIAAGFEIPTMCNNGEVEHFASCMVCVVKEKSRGTYLPSCSAKAVEGMDLITEDEEIIEARKTALELLLSEHVGDCEAPCRVACPAFMNIPEMNRLIASGKTEKAYEIVKNDIALPGVLGRICPAPCEGACRRKPIDQSVSICLLKRFTADQSVSEPVITDKKYDKKVCIIGGGPAGLSASYYLQQKGIQTYIYDNHEKAGGALRYSISDEILDKSVLDYEIDVIRKMGTIFLQNQQIDTKKFIELSNEFDAIVLATGNFKDEMKDWGLANDGKQILADKSTYITNINKVFAIGNTTRSSKLAIRSAAQGKEVSVAIEQMFKGDAITGETRRFNSTIGKLVREEYSEYLKESTNAERRIPVGKHGSGYDIETARIEAARCMHCDCRKADNCLLRNHSDDYKVSKKRFFYSERLPVIKNIAHNMIAQEMIIYEPGKCIKCGICVRMTAKYTEEFGFTFIGRGFSVEIGVPFNEKIELALTKTAAIVAEACPTGALSSLENNKKKK